MAVHAASQITSVPAGRGDADRGWDAILIALLALAALLPRLSIAACREVLCTDGVFFVERAEAWQRGDATAALFGLDLNAYPLILAALAQAGATCQAAGKFLAVICSTLVVLPLYELVRPMAGRPAALLACLLYALHPEALEWSAEVVREPLYWLASLSTLTLAHRMAQAPSLAWGLCTGAIWTLAVLTRFEGWLLLAPAVCWFATRAWFDAALGRKLATALIACALVWLLSVCLLNVMFVRGHDAWRWGRFDHVGLSQRVLARLWASDRNAARSAALGSSALDSSQPTHLTGSERSKAPTISLRELAWGFHHTALSGIHPLVLLLFGLGVVRAIRAREAWKWAPLWILAALQCLAIGLYLASQRETTARYFVNVALAMFPTAACGLLMVGHAGWQITIRTAAAARWAVANLQAGRWQAGRVVRQAMTGNRLAGLAADFGGASVIGPLACCGLLLVTVQIAMLSAEQQSGLWREKPSRKIHALLGRWLAQQIGPGHELHGTENLERLVGYYAGCRHRAVPHELTADQVNHWITRHRPAVVVAWHDPRSGNQFAEFAGKHATLGYQEVSAEQLPAECRRATVWLRQGLAQMPIQR